MINSGKLNIRSGTLLISGTQTANIIILNSSGATLNIYGGTLDNECFTNAADRLSNHYGFLVVNWEDKNVWFENIDAMFFNNITGIFTNNSFIKDRNDEVKKFDRICGILFYRRIPTEFGNSNKFIDYRLSDRYFIKNPFAKEIDDNIIHQLLIPNKVLKPKNEYDEITEYDLESNPMFLYS